MTLVNPTTKISRTDLKQLASTRFGDLIKAVVDVSQGIMIADADLHADEEAALLQQGSKQEDLWGINLYPDIEGENWIEFDSMINLRPSQKNNSRGVEDPKLQAKIRQVVSELVTP